MEIIETLDHEAFTHYLKKFGNTICGRHPIGVFLGAVQALRQRGTNGFVMNLKFLNYDQVQISANLHFGRTSFFRQILEILKWIVSIIYPIAHV
jgi:hypothetical protein